MLSVDLFLEKFVTVSATLIIFYINTLYHFHLSQRIYSCIHLTGKPTGQRPLGSPRRRWEHNIRMDLGEIGISAGNWVDSAQDRNYWRALVNAALKLRIP